MAAIRVQLAQGLGARPLLRAAVRCQPRAVRRCCIAASSAPDRPSGGGARFAAPAPAAPASSNGAEAAAPVAPTVVVVQGEVGVSAVLTPAQIYHKAAEMGAYKTSLPWWKIVLLGTIAGCYVGLGGALLLTVGPNCPGIASSNPGLAKYITGAIGFPFALLQILTCGAELFTGNTALCAAAVFEGKATMKGLLKSWVCSYAGNILGCSLALLLFANSGLLPQLTTGAQALAVYKTAAPLKEVVVKAICANWFVCLAVWQATAAQTFGGKFIACLGPVSAFVAVGLEHCIANMFFVPLGIIVGAPVDMTKFLTANLIPVTLGNIFAGVVCVAATYSLIYGALGKKLTGQAA